MCFIEHTPQNMAELTRESLQGQGQDQEGGRRYNGEWEPAVPSSSYEPSYQNGERWSQQGQEEAGQGTTRTRSMQRSNGPTSSGPSPRQRQAAEVGSTAPARGDWRDQSWKRGTWSSQADLGSDDGDLYD